MPQPQLNTVLEKRRGIQERRQHPAMEPCQPGQEIPNRQIQTLKRSLIAEWAFCNVNFAGGFNAAGDFFE